MTEPKLYAFELARPALVPGDGKESREPLQTIHLSDDDIEMLIGTTDGEKMWPVDRDAHDAVLKVRLAKGRLDA